MRVRINILKEGDTVLSVWDSHVAVKKPSGEVEIFRYYFDEEKLPRLADGTIFITYGDGTVSAKLNEADEDSIEVMTF